MSDLILIMGVSGCGKTTVAERVAAALQAPFIEADAIHSQENVAKMAAGVPLTDADRWPWLDAINRQAVELRARQPGHPVVLACSALKEAYRDRLRAASPALRIVYLKGNYNLILARMEARGGHFMKANMLRSQFEALEEPVEAIVIDISQPLETIVGQVLRELDATPD